MLAHRCSAPIWYALHSGKQALCQRGNGPKRGIQRRARELAHQIESRWVGGVRGNGEPETVTVPVCREMGTVPPWHTISVRGGKLGGLVAFDLGLQQRGHVALHPPAEQAGEPGERAAERRQPVLDAWRQLGVAAPAN